MLQGDTVRHIGKLSDTLANQHHANNSFLAVQSVTVTNDDVILSDKLALILMVGGRDLYCTGQILLRKDIIDLVAS